MSIRARSAAVLAITENEGYTDPQKVAALAELFRAEAKSWGINESDAANEGITDLVTFPVNVVFS